MLFASSSVHAFMVDSEKEMFANFWLLVSLELG